MNYLGHVAPKVRNRVVEGHNRKPPIKYVADPRSIAEIYSADGEMTDLRKRLRRWEMRKELQRKGR